MHNTGSRKEFGKRYDDYNAFTDEAIKAFADFTSVININAEPNMDDVWKSFYSAVKKLGNNIHSASD